ncbi:MAG TPA: A24 family peptidase C-terminal domain-containing protein [Candidatus Nitrosotalea sp.]|nr:A24 family peptidase C-terminal domain-containing protein [Candidatus Nitrosotalea sp.]
MIVGTIDGLRVILALSMLGLATYWDLKTREVSDLLWMVFGGVAIALILLSTSIAASLVGAGISLIVAPVVLIIWRMGLFGGADAFCVIVLAALAPGLTLTSGTVTPFTTLTNSAILSASPIVLNVSRNLVALARGRDIFLGLEDETKGKKITALFLGYRAKNPKFSFPLERQDGNSRKFDFTLINADNAKFCSTPDTWVTPGVPYMIYITAGFIVQLVFGDIIFHFIKLQH